MNQEPDISLRRVSAAELVADTLMQLIVSGQLPAGEPLREGVLSGRLGISRNSLREGIRLLEQSRLVKYELHRGAVVNTFTLSDLEDLYRTRLHIELAAVEVEPSETQVSALRTAFRTLEASAASQDPHSIVTADLELHKAIVHLLQSERIDGFYAQICKELVFYFTVLSYVDEEHVSPEISIVKRHQEILHAIFERRPGEARELLHAHILQNFDRLKEIVAAREEAAKH